MLASAWRPASGDTDRGLVRAMGRWDLTAIAVNGMVGAGIFGLPAVVAREVGVLSPLAFVGCALIVGTVVLCFMEAASRFETTGGPYEYARAAFGDFIGFQTGWLRWLADGAAVAANLNLLAAYAAAFLPVLAGRWTRWTAMVVLVGAMAALNVRGVRYSARVVGIMTVLKLLPLVVLVGFGLFHVDGRVWADVGRDLQAGDFRRWTLAVLVLAYAYMGFEDATIPAGETRDPRRAAPAALLTAVALVTAVYVLVQTVCVGVVPDLAKAERPLAEAGTRVFGPWGGSLLTASALVSITGNMLGAALSYPRLTYALARDGLFPAVFAAVHWRYRTPYASILLYAGVVGGLAVSGTYERLVTLSAVALTLVYGATCLAVPVLRRRYGPATLQIPGGTAVALSGMVLTLGLLAVSRPAGALGTTAGAVAVGTLLMVLGRRSARPGRGPGHGRPTVLSKLSVPSSLRHRRR
jgi:amino acid transporter